MSLDIALSVFGVTATALLLGFLGSGVFARANAGRTGAADVSSGPDASARVTVLPVLGVAVAFLGSCLRLVDPALIDPLWLQYLVLAGVPAAVGFGAGRMVVGRTSTEE